MRNRIELLAGAVWLVGGSLLVATPASASTAAAPLCSTVLGTACPGYGAVTWSGLDFAPRYEEPLICFGGRSVRA